MKAIPPPDAPFLDWHSNPGRTQTPTLFLLLFLPYPLLLPLLFWRELGCLKGLLSKLEARPLRTCTERPLGPLTRTLNLDNYLRKLPLDNNP